jgi:small GTP-binding protein
MTLPLQIATLRGNVFFSDFQDKRIFEPFSRNVLPMSVSSGKEGIHMQDMRRKKICIIGASAVGKTSLVASYSGAVFSSGYHPTLGVRITIAVVAISERLKELVVWDIKGESEFYRINPAYLYGSDGYVLVADGTRRATLGQAMDLQTCMKDLVGDIPHVMLINKLDLDDIWEMDDALLSTIRSQVSDVYTCSARGGITIHNAIETLARRMWGVK